MKTMSKLFGIVTVLTLTLFLVSSTVAPDAAKASNGTVVNMVKNAGYTIGGGCLPATPEKSSSTQYKNGSLHMLTVHWDFSGTCLVPAKGVAKYPVGTPWGLQEFKVNPSGMGHLKIIVN